MHLGKWEFVFWISIFLVVLGFFLPPVAIILMVTPIILPSLKALQIDLVWFGIIMTILMEMGLIHPPVGLNLFVIQGIAPDLKLRNIVWGTMPFIGLMVLGIVLLCFFPEIALWLPNHIYKGSLRHAGRARSASRETASARARLARVADALGPRLRGKRVATEDAVALLEAAIEPGDRVCLEGNNQKQADFLAEALAACDPRRVHDLHLVQSVLALPSHMELFERGIARRVDFSFSGPQATRLARLVQSRKIEIGAIHTYLELFGRYFIDLTPKVCLVAAQAVRRRGQPLHRPEHRGHAGDRRGDRLPQRHRHRAGQRGASTRLPRVDIPGRLGRLRRARAAAQLHRAAVHPRPGADHRDPGADGDDGDQGHLRRVRRRSASTTASASTPRRSSCCCRPTPRTLGLKGKICQHWALNPHPTLIPAIEGGLRRVGAQLRLRSRAWRRTSRRVPTCSSPAATAACASNRAMCQTAGLYACDLFIGSTLQIDLAGNSSTATLGRIAGFGGAPNMGTDARGRRHASPAWLKAGRETRGDAPRAARAEARRADGRDLPRAHAARVRREARRVGADGRHGHGAAADHDLRRRRHAHRHRGRHRQPAAVPQRRRSASRRSAASPASRPSGAGATSARSRTCATAA